MEEFKKINKKEIAKCFILKNYNFITNKTPKLLVIDESHNLRNNKSNRYKFLLEEIIKKNGGNN